MLKIFTCKEKSMKAKISILYSAIALMIIMLYLPIPAVTQDRTVHFMVELPQSNITNPALIPKYPGYIGFPLFSSTYIEFNNSFSYEDLFVKRDNKIYLDRDALMDNLNDKNYTGIYTQFDLLSFGFSIKKLYLSFRASTRADVNLFYSKDFIKLLTYGNGHEDFFGKNTKFTDTKLNSSAYHEMAISGGYQINEKWTAGVSFRYLLGIANIYSEKVDCNLTTDPDDYTLTTQTDILIHSSLPVVVSSDGGSGDDFETADIIGSRNPGFAIDFGATYKPIDKLTVSASVLDLGSINWTRNARKIYTADPSKEVVFDGLDLNDFVGNGAVNQDDFNDNLDSIAQLFGIEEAYENYKSPLNTKFMVSGTYDLSKKDHVGLMFRSSFVSSHVRPSVTVAYRRELLRRVSGYASVSAYENAYFNVGFGLIAGIGPVQFYVVNDNLLALFMPRNTKNYNARFGINFVIGNRDKKTPEPVQAPAETQF